MLQVLLKNNGFLQISVNYKKMEKICKISCEHIKSYVLAHILQTHTKQNGGFV